MSWTNLPTDYADAVWEGERKYTINLGGGGTYQNSTITDETPYTPSEVGGNYFYGANDANQTNDAINKIVAACGGDVNNIVVGVENGGTGATTLEQARANLGINRPTHLYNNSSGTTGTITLSKSCENIPYIEIYFKDNDNDYGSSMCYYPNGKTLAVSLIKSSPGSRTWIKTSILSFSGDTITQSGKAQTTLPNGGSIVVSSDSVIKITRIVAYEY